MSGDLSDTTKFRPAAGAKPQPAYSAALSTGPARAPSSNNPHDTPGGSGRPDGHANCVPAGGASRSGGQGERLQPRGTGAPHFA